MNRIPKFRVWDKQQLKMFYLGEGYCVHITSDGFCLFKGFNEDLVSDHHNSILLESTGLKDKNDVDIYEGDIVLYDVKSAGFDSVFDQPPVVVIYKEENARFDFMGSFNGFIYKSYIVIGNIYENPELLKK